MPVFQLIAERYLDPQYAPESVAPICGIPAARIRALAAEIARAAFEEEIEIATPWTDWAGRRHETMRGRPVSMHAMRGISAHSNGFQTCRALHLLQILIGTIDVPGGWRYKSPYPKPAPPGPKPAGKPGQVVAGKPMPGAPLGYPMGPEDLILDEEGKPERIDKAFSWDAPIAAHGLMHMLIRNAWNGDPYPIDTLFMYMANMAWNSAMNIRRDDAHADRQGPGDRRIPHPAHHLFRRVLFRDRGLRRSGPARHDLSRALGLHLAARPADRRARTVPAIRSASRSSQPDRDVRPFQDVLIELGARLGLPAFVDAEGAPRYPGGYKDYIALHERAPGIGPLAGWRGEDGEAQGRGAPNPKQLDRYIANGCFWKYELPPEQLYYKHANKAYLETATAMGLIGAPDPIVLQLYVEPLQRFRLAARGHGPVVPPEKDRARIETYFDPLPFWYPPFEEARIDLGGFPLHAITQRPMQMYHSWHSQNAWLRQILGQNRLFINRATGRALGLDDDDWVWVSSHAGRIEAQIKLMDGVNPDTVWTWNAIGKRSGAWNLAPNSPEFTRGFLLNHLISDLLPPPPEASRTVSQCRPDHRPGRLVRSARPRRESASSPRRATPRLGLRRCATRPRCRARRRSCATARGSPDPKATTRGRGGGHDRSAAPASGSEKARPRHRPRSLRRLSCLRDRVQGMEHIGGHMGPLPDFNAYERRRLGRVVQPHPFVRGRRLGRGRGGRAHRPLP